MSIASASWHRAGWLVASALALVGMSRALEDHAPARARRVAVEIDAAALDETIRIAGGDVDVWTEHPDGDVVVAIAEPALRTLGERGIPARVVVDDLDRGAVAERARLRRRHGVIDWFGEYRDLDEVNAFVDRLAARHRDRATVLELGRSIEDRPIRALAISRGAPLAIVVDGGQHAREWISVMVATCIADRLLAEHPRILDDVSFYIVPVANPDGYAYSWQRDRYWRKNRRGGYGVDLNRNYSVGWGGAGSSGVRGSPNYRGEQAFSEPETRAMRALFERVRAVAHVDLHSYAQVIVYPWSHTREEPPDAEAFAALAEGMRTAIAATHGKRYQIRPGSTLRVGAGGTLGDWAYGEHRALSFLVELRPARGPDGFLLPPEQIRPTCDESYAAVRVLADQLVTARDRS